jgi:NAD(P)-dependent dehydrogenase (short-subunit alcohol dehydrogenase family)
VASTRFDLTGKTALITGGSKGLGKAMARALAEAGCNIVISSRHEDELKPALAEILAGTIARGNYLVADLGVRSEAERLAAVALKTAGKIDILINNAGTNKPQPSDAIQDATWDQVLDLNLYSVMALTRALIPPMKERRWGRIIHISSILGFVSKEGRSVYSASKSALLGLARAEALDLGPWGITVNCIAPGPFLTDLPASVLSDAEKRIFAERTALGRWGEPHELGGTALLPDRPLWSMVDTWRAERGYNFQGRFSPDSANNRQEKDSCSSSQEEKPDRLPTDGIRGLE